MDNKFNKDYFTSTTTKSKKQINIYVKILQKLIGHPIKNKKILDIGCATGNLVRLLNEDNDCFGIDISNIAINQARKNSPNSQFQVLDVNSGKLDRFGDIDIIFMLDVIEHLHNFTNLMDYLLKLKPGAKVLLTTPNGYSLERFLFKEKSTPELDSTHTIIFTTYTIDFFLKRCGLKKDLLCTPYSFYFNANMITKKIPFGGQILAIYTKI